MNDPVVAYHVVPDTILMNGKGPYGHPLSISYESFNVSKGMILKEYTNTVFWVCYNEKSS